ncbi:hypothetical protein CH254_20010 [Rhodococcus sp. 06-412-2C]|uniref:sensor histidine kinase n=1 Tax=unclassified Rhodococcus (in: high G+C Gram-positive bacteria) TaxID=192944 RepID=UPI000B9A2C94|nr:MULTISPECIES: sensor histidine kinase [unclassified Rhodococcus (in: high G+C Gram-positive bacteria)]OZC84694.1 hypothetical protein CH254_20010 [Rhodococcus sp. 06-412-2C]OZC98348.1 hypothetical protein CH279_12655 [Rhodococcus sp. 06-412-2B]
MTVIDGARSSRRNHRFLDCVVAAAVFAYNLPVQGFAVPDSAVSWIAYALPVGLCLPYIFHRRRPLSMFSVIVATAYLQLTLGVELLVADVMLVPALHAVARSRPPSNSVPAAVAVAVWTITMTMPSMERYSMSFGDVGLLVLIVAMAWLTGMLARVRNEYVHSLQLRAEQVERDAAAAERTRIAREIHDIVSHSLSAIVLLSEGAAGTVRQDPDAAAAAMKTVRDTGREAMTEMRSMLTVLHSDDPVDRVPAPGVAQLDGLVERSRAVGIPVDYRVTGEPVELPPGLQLVIYRVIQESLTNVGKHAGPEVRAVRVHLNYGPATIELTVADDGRGTDSSSVSGWGLMGMRERVLAQGGTFDAGPTADGFHVAVSLPTEAAR